MRRMRFSVSSVVVAGLIGCAAALYAVRGLDPDAWLQKPGVWDLMALVTTEPRFTGLILFTAALLRTVLLPEPILPTVLRRGTYRQVLAHEAVGAVRSAVLPVIAVVSAVGIVAVSAGLDFGARLQPGTAAAALADAHLPVAVGVLMQILLVVTVTTVVDLALVSVRIALDSIVPVVVGALLFWCWVGVSLLQLQTVIDPQPGLTAYNAVAESLSSSVSAGVNSAVYLDLLITIGSRTVPTVLVALVVAAGASYALVAVLDLRVRRGRRLTPPLLATTSRS